MESIPPLISQSREDALNFSHSSNGNFTVKVMFNVIAGWKNPMATQNPIWNIIWKKGCLSPRLRLFLWRMANNALPLFDILANQGISLDKACLLCKHGDESMAHTFFTCNFARSRWFGSTLALRSDSLNGSIQMSIQVMGSH